MESRGECQEAQKLLGMIKTGFPEVLTAIKTKQLAQEILLNKEEHIGEVAKTGEIYAREIAAPFVLSSHSTLCKPDRLLLWYCMSF